MQLSQLLQAAEQGIITDAVIIFGDAQSFNVAVTAQNLILYYYAAIKAADLLDKSIMSPQKPASSIVPVRNLADINLKEPF